MKFYGSGFSFNGVHSSEYDLMIYSFGDNEDKGRTLSAPSIIETRSSAMWRPHFLGVKHEHKIEFEITFGVNINRIDEDNPLNLYEITKITTWLTGSNSYEWMTIDQPDAQHIRYRCMITKLQTVTSGEVTWGFKATVTCDGPYSYLATQTFSTTVNGSTLLSIFNPSSCMWYRPIVIYKKNGSAPSLRIKNISDSNRVFELNDIPGSVSTIRIDNDNCVIENDQMLNLYLGCNYKFLRLARGNNTIEITGNGAVDFICDFPVNTGG